ncbi:RadC family protein [Kerstersia similis]|uniref:RadC family protein n=1 Tax=Kerstersia similis TaxID=206505 RepID=UPI0039EE6C6A
MPETQTSTPLLPRERLIRYGAAALEDAELLAIMLRTGTANTPVLSLARQLLQGFGGLRQLLAADRAALAAIPGLGPAKSCQLVATMELARRSCAEALQDDNVMQQPEAVARYCAAHLAHLRIEHCIALYLDNRLRLLACRTLSQGTTNQASVYVGEVVRSALAHHASAMILAHNHPSGSLEPSQADIELTRKAKAALALVDIKLVDHLIIAGNASCSLAALGLC